MALPGCMMPDGGQACPEYAEAIADVQRLTAELAAARVQLSAIRTLVMEAGCNSKNCIGMPPDSATQYCCPWHLKRWELLSDTEPGTP